MKILAIIITYYPDMGRLIKNINCFVNYVDNLIIWENTPSDKLLGYDYNAEIKYNSRCIIRGTGKNEGIAFALNQAIKYMKKGNYTHLLTLDQDSEWKNFKDYIDIIAVSKISEGIFSPNMCILDRNMKVTVDVYKRNEQFLEISHCMTSGALYPLSVIKKTGEFREDYFIDAIDTEYCLRAAKYGIKTYVVTQAVLFHSLGLADNRVMGIYVSNYSPFRSYYIVRNHLLLSFEYEKISSLSVIWNLVIKRIIKIVLWESYKYSKIKAIFRGIYDAVLITYK